MASSKKATSKKAAGKSPSKAKGDGDPVTMFFADPDTIEAGEHLVRTVSSLAFRFGAQDKMTVRIGNGKFTSDSDDDPGKTEKWLTGTFVSDSKVSIDFNVADKTPDREIKWKVYLRHTPKGSSKTARYKSEEEIVFLQE